MKLKDLNTTANSLPKLLVFKTVQHMRNWRDQKLSDEMKLEEEKKSLEERYKKQGLDFPGKSSN